MRKLLFIFLLLSGVAKATGYSGLNTELFYLYGSFVFVVVLVVGVDYGVKFIHKKLKEREAKYNGEDSINPLEE